MREIKFRVWSKYSRKMFEEGFYLSLDGDLFQNDELDYKNKSSFEIMQYTGLKDKNGKEIYEGDVVRTWEQDEHIPERDSGGGIIGFDTKEGFSQIGVVDFKGAWFTYETKKHLEGRKEQIFAPLDFTNDLEVIGNIYENPELLEVNK